MGGKRMELQKAECEAYRRRGYALLAGAFAAEELACLRDAAEETVAAVVASARADEGSREFRLHEHRFQFARQSLIQWEWREGSEFPWHQDYPYWYVRTPEHAHEVLTAILFLDDAVAANGALRVLPGSHLEGPAPRNRGGLNVFTADPACIDEGREVLVEAPAGSLLFFPALLLHRSSPNTSDRQRRALLLSFQPTGRPRHETLPWHPEKVEELP